MSTNSTPLPFSSWEAKPQFGEPGHEYFVRLVREQDHTSARVYAADLEVNGRNMRPTALLDQVLRLPLSENHVESLRRWTPVLEPSWVHLSGQTIRRMQYAHLKRRFCSACLAESPHHRVFWEIKSFTVCPFHRTPIKSETPQGNVVKWWWPDFEYGPDGERLASPASLDQEEDSYEVYLLQRLGLDVGVCRPRPILDGFELGVVVDVCEALGRFLGNPASQTGPERQQRDYRLGYDAARYGEEFLEHRLSEWFVANSSGPDQLLGLHSSAGWFVQTRNHVLGPAWPLLQKILKRAFVKVGNIGRFKKDENPLVHARMTLQEVSQHTGIHVLGVRAIVTHLGIVRAPNDFYWFIDRDRLPEIEAFIADLISFPDAAAILGCAWSVARDLGRRGFLTTLVGTSLTGQSGVGAATLRSEVEMLWARALAIKPTETNSETSSLFRYSQKSGLSMGTVVERVLRGEIAPATHMNPVKGMSSWRFTRPRKRGWRVKRELGGDLTVPEVSVTTGIQLQSVVNLIAGGVLESRKHQTSVAVDRRSFEAFHARFVNARLFQEEIGCSFLSFEKALAALGVPRCFTEIKSRHKVHIVERKALERVLGIKTEPSKGVQTLWGHVLSEMYRRKTRFALPVKLGTKPMKCWQTSRLTYVWFSIDGAAIVADKVFTPDNKREWSRFTANRSRIEEDMGAFEWTADGDGVRYRFSINSREDAVVAADSFLAIEKHFLALSSSERKRVSKRD